MRILLVSDVPIENVGSGCTFLYRLFQNYPAKDLMICFPSHYGTALNKRLPGVLYKRVHTAWGRIFRTRYQKVYSTFNLVFQCHIDFQIRRILCAFKPDGLFLVAHDYSWISAARQARRLGIPYVVFIMDHWPKICPVLRPFEPHREGRFREALMAASGLFCVSPEMSDRYSRDYENRVQVVYPLWQSEQPLIPKYEVEGNVSGIGSSSFCLAYAGYLGSLDEIAPVIKALKEIRGKLLLYSQLPETDIPEADRGIVESHPIRPWEEVCQSLLSEADALLVRQSFCKEAAEQEATNFKVKITDYTELGIPLLIWAPPYASSIRWWRENDHPAFVCWEEDSVELVRVLNEIRSQPERSQQVARQGRRIGEEMFAKEKVLGRFFRALNDFLGP